MSKARTKSTGGVPVLTEEIAVVRQPESVLSIIDRAIDNPNVSVEVMRGLFELQKDFNAEKARVAFNEAMSTMQPLLPRVTRHGNVDYVKRNGDPSKKEDHTKFGFARYEDIDVAVRPLLSDYGFSVSYDQNRIEKETEYVIRLSHIGGHFEERRMRLPNDESGGKNPIQAIGSTISYARRYLLSMILNIVTIGQDDDAQTFSYVTDVQAAQLNERIDAEQIDRVKLLNSVGADSVEHIPASRFSEVVRKMDERRIKLNAKREAEVS